MQTAKLTKLTNTSDQALRLKLLQDTIAEHDVSAEEKAQLDQFIQWVLERNSANS